MSFDTSISPALSYFSASRKICNIVSNSFFGGGTDISPILEILISSFRFQNMLSVLCVFRMQI